MQEFSDDFDSLENEIDDEKDLNNQNISFAINVDEHLHSHLKGKSFLFRSGGAINESEKEFEIFAVYRDSGGGRSYTYIATLFNYNENRILQIAKKNNWAQRVADFDREQLVNSLALEKDARAIEHKRKLEVYRSQQEFLGRALSADAAKLAQLASRTLNSYLENDREIDLRDLPALLNSAAKIADVGKNLQSGALGVEQLLVALEEADIDE
jgi:Mor family transcriptional regulator